MIDILVRPTPVKAGVAAGYSELGKTYMRLAGIFLLGGGLGLVVIAWQRKHNA